MDTDVVDDEFIMPGDDLSTRIYSKVDGDDSKFVIGPGLVRNQQKIVAVKPGVLKTRDRPTVFWIDSHQRRVSFLPILLRIFQNFHLLVNGFTSISIILVRSNQWRACNWNRRECRWITCKN